MRRIVALLLGGVMLGYFSGLITEAESAPVSASAHSVAPGDADLPPPIPPVANPPLYPDPPNRPMHWTASEIAELYERRLAWIRAGGSPRDPRDGPPFEGQFFRTHLIHVLGRTTFDPPRPSNIIGVMSRHDDADLHEGVSDFYVMAGGAGRIAAGGYIENRQQGRVPYYPETPAVLLPGEFNGQPIRDATVFDVRPGDWVAIPPNVAHAPGLEPNEYLMYAILKVNVGLYPQNAMY